MMSTIVLSISTFVFVLLTNTFNNSKKGLNEIIQQQTADIPDGRYLFLRCSGDEAAAGLSSAQFIAWLGLKTTQLLNKFSFLNYFFNINGAFRKILFAISIIVLSNTLLFIVKHFSEISWIFIYFIKEVFKSNFQSTLIIDLATIIFLLITLILLFILSIFTIIIFIIFLIISSQAVMSWAFGWTQLFTGLLVELAIEPLPFESHSLTHIDWSVDNLNLRGITHSWTYAHPLAIKHLQNWVKAALLE